MTRLLLAVLALWGATGTLSAGSGYHVRIDLSGLQRDRLSVVVDVPPIPQRGLANLGKHMENIRSFGLEPVVALNRFREDTLAAYLELPNVLCAGGSWMAPDEDIANGAWSAIAERARRVSRPRQ